MPDAGPSKNDVGARLRPSLPTGLAPTTVSRTRQRAPTHRAPLWLCCRAVRQGEIMPRGFTRAARRAGWDARTARANKRAADLAPVIAELRAAGITSKKRIAEAFNERPTARGTGHWYHPQVGRLLARIPAQHHRNAQSEAANEGASPSSGEVWSWDCGPESVSGHPTSATTSSHFMSVTNFGPDRRRGRRESRKLVPLYLITYPASVRGKHSARPSDGHALQS
jgi:hypothetical protein